MSAACSQSVERFGPYKQKTASASYGNPYPSAPASGAYSPSDPVNTASFSNGTAPVGRVQSRPLGDVTPPPRSYGSGSSSYNGSSYKGSSYGGSSYKAPSYRPTRPGGAPVASNDTITVQPGETLYRISRRHGVTVSEMAAANDISAPYALQVGQHLTLPSSASPSNVASYRRPSPQPRRQQVADASDGGNTSVHTVDSGETLYSISREYGVKPQAIASRNGLAAPYTIQPGQNIRIPGALVQTASAEQVKTRTYEKDQTRITPVRAEPNRTVAIKSDPEASSAGRSSEPSFRGPLPRPEARTGSKFRWPVKGKVISSFGPKANGVRNDGINIAVPAGTTVRAAENGVVAYAGNELKGYGNLILIRHSDNWVTAYAHNSDLFARRGDKVRRGQIIAKAGQSGSVSSPQVHFEIRRGAQAVNPVSHMSPTHLAAN